MPRMTAIRRLLPAALLLMLLVPGSAHAGSVGFFDQTGFHFGDALSSTGGQGQWMDQGVGFELLLGNAASRVQGRVRLSYSAIIDLTAEAGADGSVGHAGVVGGGAHVELLPEFDTKKVGLYVLGDVGVSPLVSHNRVFAFVDVGAGVRFDLAERLSMYVEATGWFRFEKVPAGGPLFFVGARIELD
jgi:hypothetical protein